MLQNSRGKVPEFFLLNYQTGFKKTWQQDIKDGIFIYSIFGHESETLFLLEAPTLMNRLKQLH